MLENMNTYTERKEALARIAYLILDIKNTNQIFHIDVEKTNVIYELVNSLWADSFVKSLSGKHFGE